MVSILEMVANSDLPFGPTRVPISVVLSCINPEIGARMVV